MDHVCELKMKIIIKYDWCVKLSIIESESSIEILNVLNCLSAKQTIIFGTLLFIRKIIDEKTPKF